MTREQLIEKYVAEHAGGVADGADLRVLLAVFARDLRKCRSRRSMEELERFCIVDYCLENHRDSTGAHDLAETFKALHDRYGWRYADLHEKFKREVDVREDVYIVRTSEIFLRGAERKQYPIYNNQRFSHLMKR